MTEGQGTAGRRPFETEIEINAPVEAVWKALTDATELTRWFPLEAQVTPGLGGRLRWSVGPPDNLYKWESAIEIWEPNRHLRGAYDGLPNGTVQSVSASGEPSQAPLRIAMDFYLEARGGKTVLRLVHSGFGAGADWDHEYDSVSRGWPGVLRELRHYLEHHQGRARAVALARTEIAASFEEGWRRLTGANGLAREGSLASLREGDHYAIVAATGEGLQGTVLLFEPPMVFCASVENLNNAFLSVHLIELGGPRQVWVWLSTYGLPQTEVEAFQTRWTKLLEALFVNS